jgi:hypothetical protein
MTWLVPPPRRSGPGLVVDDVGRGFICRADWEHLQIEKDSGLVAGVAHGAVWQVMVEDEEVTHFEGHLNDLSWVDRA